MVYCVTGHRPAGFPFSRDENDLTYMNYCNTLYDTVKDLVFDGYDLFITGMADGADIDFAYVVLFLRDEDWPIKLEAALPYPYSPRKKVTPYIENLESVLINCNFKTIVSSSYFKGCMQKRNRYMVDKADLVLAIWNGEKRGGTWNTIDYAISKNKPIRYIMLKDILPLI